MAICKACGGEMTQGISCSPTVRIRIWRRGLPTHPLDG